MQTTLRGVIAFSANARARYYLRTSKPKAKQSLPQQTMLVELSIMNKGWDAHGQTGWY